MNLGNHIPGKATETRVTLDIIAVATGWGTVVGLLGGEFNRHFAAHGKSRVLAFRSGGSAERRLCGRGRARRRRKILRNGYSEIALRGASGTLTIEKDKDACE
jgi:phage terminase large subunit GpA-like protein